MFNHFFEVSNQLINLRGFKIISIETKENNLALFFDNPDTGTSLKVILENVINHSDLDMAGTPGDLRITHDLTVYGLDFSLTLQKPEIKDYKTIYIIEDSKQFRSLFRALVEKITVTDDSSVIL